MLIAFIGLLFLQWFPFTGIFLMILGGPLLAGLVFNLLMLALAIESVTGRVPRILVLVPLLAVGGYYALYAEQGQQIAQRQAELKASNPTLVMQFDPGKHDLVMKHAGGFVQRHRLPVVYAPNSNVKPEQHNSHRLVPAEIARAIPKDSLSRINVSYVLGRRIKGSYRRQRLKKKLAVLRFPQDPSKTVVTIERKDQQVWKHKPTIEEGVYRVVVGGKVLDEYRTASVFRYARFPLPIIGCGLNSGAPSWDCGATMMKSRLVLDTLPDGMERTDDRDPVAIMLGIARYTQDELDTYQGYPEHAAALDHVRGEAARIEDDVFDQLKAIMADDTMKAPWRLSYSLTRKPERLVPIADELTTYFEHLVGSSYRQVTDLRGKRKAIAAALASLPPNTFDPHAERIFTAYSRARTKDKSKRSRTIDTYPNLYLRMAQVGSLAARFYSDELLTKRPRGWLRFLAPLALCRLGEGDAEVVAFLKEEYAKGLTDGRHDSNYHQALFLALVGLGEKAFAETHLPTEKLRYDAWYRAVLNGEGDKDGRPNNCMVRDWPMKSYLPNAFAGSLPKK